MPAVTTDGDAFTESIRRERRVELAFEDHRFWDVRRWGKADAESALGVPVKGVSITKTETGFTYATKIVGTRTFQEKMMLYPIPQSEILRSAGKIEQNPGW